MTVDVEPAAEPLGRPDTPIQEVPGRYPRGIDEVSGEVYTYPRGAPRYPVGSSMGRDGLVIGEVAPKASRRRLGGRPAAVQCWRAPGRDQWPRKKRQPPEGPRRLFA